MPKNLFKSVNYVLFILCPISKRVKHAAQSSSNIYACNGWTIVVISWETMKLQRNKRLPVILPFERLKIHEIRFLISILFRS